MRKENGVNKLSEEQENLRMTALELEFKARYWKAQYEIRYYTLEAEKIQPEYDKYLAVQRQKNEELQKLFMEQMQKNQEAGLGLSHIVTQEDLDANPDLVDEGISVGDEIGLGPQTEPTAE